MPLVVVDRLCAGDPSSAYPDGGDVAADLPPLSRSIPDNLLRGRSVMGVPIPSRPAALRDDVETWCKETLGVYFLIEAALPVFILRGEDAERLGKLLHVRYILFETAQDAIAFQIRWL